MKVPDGNVLLYARDETSPRHSQSRGWLEAALSRTETVGFAWIAVLAFLRVSTNSRIFENALPVGAAFDQIDEWLSQFSATVIHPGERHLGIVRSLLEQTGTAGNLTSDAHLAAIAIEHGATLTTFDGDFHRFSGLKLEYLGGGAPASS